MSFPTPLDPPLSNVVLNELNTLIDDINTDSVTPEQVNGIVNDLGNVLLNAASSTFGQNQRSKKGNSGNKGNNKPWFNGECKAKRDEFHNARKKNMHHQKHLKIKHYLTQELKNIVLY